MNVGNTGGAHTSGDGSIVASTAPSEPVVEAVVEAVVAPDTSPVTDVGGDPGSTPEPVVSATKTPVKQNDSPAASAQPSTAPPHTATARDDAPGTGGDTPPPSGPIAADRAPTEATSLATAPEALEARTPALPAETRSVVATILAAAIAPFVLPGPAAPVTSPLLWAILAWTRRESEQTDGATLAARGVAAFDSGPAATDDQYETDEDWWTSGNVTDNDSIPGTGVVAVDVQPAHGTLDMDQDGQFVYTPNADFAGEDSFTYIIDDQTGTTSSATATIVVRPENDRPVGSDTAVTLTEDTSFSGTLPQATDVDGDQLVYGLPYQAANGTAVVNPDGSFSYTPGSDFHGTDGFFYTVSDGTVTVRYVVAISVTPVNDAPVGSDVVTSVSEDDYTGGALPVTDVDGDALTFGLASPATHGVAVVRADGTYTYTPAKDFNGVDSFTYGLSDGTIAATRTVTITVTAVNDAPISAHLELTIDEDTQAKGRLPAFDPDGDTITYELAGSAMNGTMVIDADGSYTYTPKPDFNGTEYLTYRMYDGTTYSQYAIYITVKPVNDAPIARDVAFDTYWGVPVSETLQHLGADVDYADPLTFAVDGRGTGAVSMNPDGTFAYTPGKGFSGDDVFTYRVTDTSGASAVGTVTVHVSNNAPLATADVYVVKNGNPLRVNAVNGVLANDYDPGDALTVVSFGTPSHGTVKVSPDGSFTYTPNGDAVGSDEFTYVVKDLAGALSTARVLVYFEQDNRPPVARDYDLTVEQGKILEFSPLLDATDLDGDALMVRNVGDPGHGFTQAITGGAIAYVPPKEFVGTDSFTYQVFDGYQYVTAKVTVTVFPATEFDAVDDDFVVRSDAVGVSLDALKNDLTPRNDTLTVAIDSETMGGTVTFDEKTRTFLYTPFAGTRSDGFTYKITDPKDPQNWDYASVNITVVQLGDPPEAEDDSASTPVDSSVTIDVLDNDWNPADGPLSVKVVSQPTTGGKAEVLKDGTIRFTPEKGFLGTVQFTYGVTDATGNVSSAIVTVDVYDPAPVSPHDRWYVVGKDGTLTVSVDDGVLASFGFEGWTAGVAEKPRNGQVQINEDGSFTYTPNAGFVGTDTFTYFAAAGEMADTALVTIQVTDAGVEQPNDGTTVAVSAGSGIAACGNDWWPRQNGADEVWPLCLYPEARRPSTL
jgi:VCBS repeat-containing protein